MVGFPVPRLDYQYPNSFNLQHCSRFRYREWMLWEAEAGCFFWQEGGWFRRCDGHMPALDFWKVYISMSQNFMIITKTITGNISQYIRDHDWARNPVLNQPIFHGMTQGIWAWEVSWGLAHRDLSRHSDLPSFAEMTVENKVHGFQPHKFGQGTGRTFTFV